MEMYVMEEVVCDLLRRHPVYRALSLKNIDECHYAIQPFGQDLCARDPLDFDSSIYGTCFSFHTLRSMLSLKHPKTTALPTSSMTTFTSTSTSTSTTPSTFPTTPSTSPLIILPTTASSSRPVTIDNNNNNNTFTAEPYYITSLVILIVILFGVLVAYKYKHPAAAVDPPAVNFFLHAFNILSNFVTNNTMSQATANFVRTLSNHITGLYPTAQTAPPPPSSSNQPQNNNSNLDNSTAISILNTPARRQSVSINLSLPHPSPSTSHSTSGNSSFSSTPNHPSTSITINDSSHSVRFHRYNLRSTPLRNN